MRIYDEGSRSGYIEPPVPAAWMRWARGDAKLATLKKSDPAAFYGGWRAFLQHKEHGSDAMIDNPTLPLPVVERVSENGEHPYKVYATNVLSFVPLQWRLRYEYREKIVDEQTGRKNEKVVQTSTIKQPGYQPNKQIFGLVFNAKTDDYAPAILFISTWSAFISMNKAAEAWKKVKALEGQILVRRYGSLGLNSGATPKFEIFGEGRSTPIDAIGTEKPRFIADNPAFDKLFDDSIAWKNCSAWNAEGKVTEEDPANGGNPALIEFDAACKEAKLTNIEIAELLSENGGDYAKALEALNFGTAMGEPPALSAEDLNARLAEGDSQAELPY
jgi:hypothetical protein